MFRPIYRKYDNKIGYIRLQVEEKWFKFYLAEPDIFRTKGEAKKATFYTDECCGTCSDDAPSFAPFMEATGGIEDMDRDQLIDYGAQFGIRLDKRMSKTTMVQKVKDSIDG